MDRRQLFFSIFAIVILVLLILGAKFFIFDQRAQTVSQLQVDSFPKATVFLDNKDLGTTPFLGEKLKPGEYTLRLVPLGSDASALLPFERKITLTSQTLTYVSQQLAGNSEQSSGQILTLERLPSSQKTEISIVTSPDGATIRLDGLDGGVSPKIISDTSVGDHDVNLSLANYSDLLVRAKIIPGFRLNIYAKLASRSSAGTLPIATTSAVPKPTSELVSPGTASELAKPYVTIKNTPTGFLRVRTDPSVSATEAGQVKPGDKYPLLEETTDWAKIKLATFSGWVSDQYVDKVK